MSVTVTPLQISTLVVTPLRVGVAPSPSDHGALAGLGDDDHPHYLNEARGDARYAGVVHAHSLADILPHRPTADYWLDIPLLDTSDYGGGEQPGFQYCASSHPLTNGPPGEESYTDHVVSWGWNVKSPSILNLAGEPGFCFTLESKFYGGRATGPTDFQTEFHFRAIRPDGSQWRPFSVDAAHNYDSAGAGFRCGIMWVGREPSVADPTDVIGFAVRPRAPADAALVGYGLVQLNMPSDTRHGAAAIVTNFPAATNKTQSGSLVAGNTNWDVTAQVANYGSGQAHIDCIVSGAGQFAGFQFIRGGGQEWAIGKHTDDNFAVQIGGYGGDVVLAIDKTTRQAAFHAPPKLPGYTVATLPSAATAGALAYVTDAAGGPTLACSDGTDWRVIAVLGAVVS